MNSDVHIAKGGPPESRPTMGQGQFAMFQIKPKFEEAESDEDLWQEVDESEEGFMPDKVISDKSVSHIHLRMITSFSVCNCGRRMIREMTFFGQEAKEKSFVEFR